MKQLIFCKDIKKKVNPQFFPCPFKFDCKNCSELKASAKSQTKTELVSKPSPKTPISFNKKVSPAHDLPGEASLGLRINAIDRRMAIKRFPEFEKDRREYEELMKKGDEDLLTKKMFEIQKNWKHPIDAILRADESYNLMKKTDATKPYFSVKPIAQIDFAPIVKFSKGDGKGIDKEWIEGDYLVLQVDIRNATEEKLKKDFKVIIKQYKRLLKDNTRDKEFYQNPWEVWDKKTKKGKNLSQITREIFDVQGNPGYDGWRDKYEQVRRAYKEAQHFFNSVRNEFGLPPI
jgi:hypothetical protein